MPRDIKKKALGPLAVAASADESMLKEMIRSHSDCHPLVSDYLGAVCSLAAAPNGIAEIADGHLMPALARVVNGALDEHGRRCIMVAAADHPIESWPVLLWPV